MKTHSKLSLITLSLMLFFNVLVINEAKAQSVFYEILKKMEKHQNSLFSLRSKVTLVKYNVQIKESDTFNGTVIYTRNSKNQIAVRVDWRKPFAETLTLINGQYVFYRPRLKQAFTGNIRKPMDDARFGNAFSFLKMSRKELKTNYIIKYLGEETVKSKTRAWHLSFTPKKADVYKYAEFWVDGNGMPIQVKVFESNNDTTTVLLSDFKKNEPIKSTVFQLKLPKETKIIKASSKASPGNVVNNNTEKTVKKAGQRKRVKKVRVRKKRLRLRRPKNAGY